MIFVTLGTQDKKFPRLLEAVDKLNTDEKIVAQVGTTEYNWTKQKEQVEAYKFLSDEQFMKYMKEARVVITHAGVGTIILGLKLHKKMIVAARLKKYREHVNDHQMQILDKFSKDGYILPLKDFNDLQKLIDTDFTPKEWTSNNKNFNEKLYNLVYNENKNK